LNEPSLIEQLSEVPELEQGESRWGGPAFFARGRELVHFHPGMVEVRLGRKLVRAALEDERLYARARTSDWIVVPESEVELVLELARQAATSS
jgi:luciferase-like monooxygenase